MFVAGAVGNYKEILAVDIVPKSKALDANFHGEGLRGDTYYDEDQFDKTLEEVRQETRDITRYERATRTF